jgi:hypothetical protein
MLLLCSGQLLLARRYVAGGTALQSAGIILTVSALFMVSAPLN